MEDKYLISVIGTQTVDGEQDTIELTTSADYIEKNGKKFIKYREYSDEENSSVYVLNLIKIENNNKITISKTLVNTSHLILECGKRHQCVYQTPIGSMSIGVYTSHMSVNLDESGGKIEVEYTIDFNAGFESENKIEIVLTAKNV